MHETRLKTGPPKCMRTRLKQGAQECPWEVGMAGSVKSTKNKDVPALEDRAGRVAVGRTTRDAAGFLAASTETELKWPREPSGQRTEIALL